MAKNKTRRRSKRNISQNKHSNGEPKCTYTRKHYESNNGMLTTVWGPSTWHLLHTMSFNYPMNPTCDDKRHYRDHILNLEFVLPCGKCRKNLHKNFEKLPLKWKHMQSRQTFSRYVYDLHEVVNTMLGKKSGLSYGDVRERYEHFRARCAEENKDNQNANNEPKSDNPIKSKLEKGCTEPINGKKSKCILQIVPQDTKCETFQIKGTVGSLKIPPSSRETD